MSGSDDDRSRRGPLGRCPLCETQIPSRALLIRYDIPDGWPRMYAECLECDVPVHPQ